MFEFRKSCSFYLHYLRAVNIKPPITNEVLLVKKCSVGTEKAELVEPANAITATNVERLASGFRISIVTIYVTITNKGGLWWLCEYRIVIPWGPWDCLTFHKLS